MNCHWCLDRPVVNAASWLSNDVPRYVPCPVCARVWSDEEIAAWQRACEREVPGHAS